MGPKKDGNKKEAKGHQEEKKEENPRGGAKKGKDLAPVTSPQDSGLPVEANKVTAPNKEAYEQAKQALEEAKSRVQAQIAAKDAKIKEKQASRDSVRANILTKTHLQQESAAKVRSIQGDITRVDVEITAIEASRIDQRTRLQEQKLQLDNAEREKEYLHASGLFAQEKKLTDSMKILKQSIDNSSKALLPENSPAKLQRERREALNHKIGLLRKDESKYAEEVKGLKKSENEISNEVAKLIKDKGDAEKEKKTFERDLETLDRNFENQDRKWRRAQGARNRLIREERQKKWEEARALEENPEDQLVDPEVKKDPYAAKYAQIDELTRYLQRLAPKGSVSDPEKLDVKKEVSVEDRNKSFEGPAAAPLAVSKKLTKKESYGPDTVKSKSQPKKEVKKIPKTLVHVPDIFKAFQQLEIVVPLTDSAIPEALRALAAKKDYYKSGPPQETEAQVPKPKDTSARKQKGANSAAVDATVREPTPAELRAADKERYKNAKKADAQAEKERLDRVAAEASEKAAAKDETVKDSARNAKKADAQAERERLDRVSAEATERAAAKEETAKERARSAKLADGAAEKERLERVSQEATEKQAAKEEGKREREHRKRLSAELEDNEQLRRIKEAAAEVDAKTKEEELSRQKRIALADLATEKERQERITANEAKKAKKDEIVAAEAEVEEDGEGDEEAREGDEETGEGDEEAGEGDEADDAAEGDEAGDGDEEEAGEGDEEAGEGDEEAGEGDEVDDAAEGDEVAEDGEGDD